MVGLGLAIKKGELWFAVLKGDNQSDTVIVTTGKHLFRASSTPDELMMDFYNLFDEIISKYSLEKIAYKIHLNSSLQQIPYMQYSFGILNYICKIKNIPVIGKSSSWISAAKGKKIIECKNHFGEQKLKDEELAAVIVSWYDFEV